MEVRRETKREKEKLKEREEIIMMLFCFLFLTEVGNGSNGIQLIEPQVAKVLTFKP